jgi:hypothetical protein
VLQIALESPLPAIVDETAAATIAPPLTSTTPEAPTAHQ